MNWAQMIIELKADGMSVADIAASMGVTPNAVREIVAGRTKAPLYDAACKLKALHKRRQRRAQRASASTAPAS